MKIWANTIVHNEENFIWFAIMSVVDFVDQILVWDTGSTDKTVEIISEIIKQRGNKIKFKEVGPVSKSELTKMRQAMLEQSKCDWILILDGDEIWWQQSIKKMIDTIEKKGDKIGGIVVPMMVTIGDLYHYQDSSAGRYNLLGQKGHFNLRAINRKIPNLRVEGEYPLEAYLDNNNQSIQQRDDMVFLDAPYLHVTHLKRSSSKRTVDKYKHELGSPLPSDFKYPEVFYQNFPSSITSPWTKLSGLPLIKSKILAPMRKIKRRVWK